MTPQQLRFSTGARRRQRGSAVVYFILIMSVMMTGMAATMATVSGVQSQISDISLKRNAAFYASEAGIQQAVWNIKNNSSWVNTLPVTVTMGNGCQYTVSSIATPNWPSNPITFTSVGTSADGSVVTQASITITSTGTAPGMAVGGGLTDSGTLTVNGGVDVVGNVTRSGTMVMATVAGQPNSSLEAEGSFTSSGTFTVPGNLEFNKAITSSGSVTVGGNAQSGAGISHSGTWNVGGSTEPNTNPALSFTTPTVNTATLISDAQSSGTTIAGGAYANKTINFNNSPDGIVYISGNATLSGTTTIIGTGTLVVAGTLTTSGTFGSNGTPAPVNIVTTGNVTMSGNLYIDGCMCSGGSFAKSNTTVINGVVVVQQGVTGSGNVTISYAPPPWFVSYSGGAGTGTVQLSNFSGASY